MVTRETELRDGLVRLGLDPRPDQVRKLLTLLQALAEEAIPRGFLGPDEEGRLLPRHLLESAALLPHLDPDGPWLDVGSGAGLPGLVLAALTCTPLTLVDAQRRRARFSERLARRLELDADAVWGRAEELGRSTEHREAYGTAVARALAPPPVALEYLLPFVRVGGRAVIAAGPGVGEEGETAGRAAALLGGGRPRLIPLEVPGLEAARWAMIVDKEDACPERYPRRAGAPARRPLGGG